MTADDILSKATALPRGAEFFRCALQVNPHGYAENFRGQPQDGSAEDHARAIVQKAEELDVRVLAITDHNDVSGVAAFRSAAELTAVHILPGFELCSKEGVHVLCIYPPDTEEKVLSRYLGELGITRPGPSSDLADKGFDEVLAYVKKQGGIAIAAHATTKKGLFGVLKGKPRINAWQSEELLSIQIPGTVEGLPQDVREIVENRNPNYRREHPAGDRLAVAVINAKDVIDPDDLENPAATTWIKMSEVSIEGLRQAFLDPESRIRLHTVMQERVSERSRLVAIGWETEGFLRDVAIHFNQDLNVLVGGRGTGKSTVIESLRHVLGLAPIGEDAEEAHAEIVRQVLRSGTKISLRIHSHRPTPGEYRIERTIPNPPVVRDAQGEISNLLPSDVLPGVEVYGQHEIAEVAKSPQKRTRLLKRFVKEDEKLPDRKRALKRELEKNRRSLLAARAELQRIDERLDQLPKLEETLERFRKQGVEKRLKERSLLVKEERVLDEIPERLASFHDCLSNLEEELPLDRAFLSPRALEGLPGREILTRADTVLDALDHDLRRIAGELRRALDRADQEIVSIRETWASRRDEVQAEYERILRELQGSQIDGEEFIRLRRQIEELQPLRERRRREEKLEEDLTARRRSLLVEWEDLKARELRGLERAASRINKELEGRIEVRVEASGDRTALEDLLRDSVAGRRKEAIGKITSQGELSLRELAETCRKGSPALVERFGLTPHQAQLLADAGPDVHLRIEELDLPPTTAIFLNTAPADAPAENLQELERVSKGQKATAVLLLLLLESDAPLIVDQPEDDLDNRFITEVIVPRMRQEKQRRQFVFSTHNANIPVLGDAELIVGLGATGEADEGHARIAEGHRGSIDSGEVRFLVEEVLEGGKEAFERRRRKYGF